MAELKVTSKKYNDKDVLEVEGDVLATKIEVSNIEALTDKQLDALKVGDVVEKKTGNQKHCYIVTYKGEGSGEGICLSYFASPYLETISYDRTSSGWVFNSKDVCEVPSENDVKSLAKEEVESAPSGTIVDALGLDSNGDLVKGAVSGGTQLYKHSIQIKQDVAFQGIDVITTSSTPITTDTSSTYAVINGKFNSYGPGTNAITGYVLSGAPGYAPNYGITCYVLKEDLSGIVSKTFTQTDIEIDTVWQL